MIERLLILLLVGLAAFAAGAYVGDARREHLAQRQQAAALKREAGLVQELEAERLKNQEVIRETIVEIQKVPDPSGCAVAAVPAARADRVRDTLHQLLRHPPGSPRPPPDR